jgi:DtxR family manganese transport transcriptional regulator
MAVYSKRKHEVLTAFLLKLGIPKEIAEIDVEGIEHYISPETLQAIEEHLKAFSTSS